MTTKGRELSYYQLRRARGLCSECGVVKSEKSKCGKCSKKYSEWQALNRGRSNKVRAERLARVLLLETITQPPKYVVKVLAEEICSHAAEWIKDNCS